MARGRRMLLPIGIHLNAEAVYMVQLEQTEGAVEVVSKAARRFPSAPGAQGRSETLIVAEGQSFDKPASAHSEEAWEFVRERITADGFRGTEAVVGLPAEHLVIQHVRFSPLQPEELEASLLPELRGRLPFDPRDAVIRHIVAGTISENSETKQDIIVLAARRAVVEAQVSAAARLGLQVVGVGVEPCAMCYPYMYAASCAPASAEGPPALMIVYLGPRTTYVAITRGQEMTFVKGLELGLDSVVEPIAKAKGITLGEAAEARAKWRESATAVPEAVETYNAVRSDLDHIVDEIESCMRYHASLSRGAHIDRLIFVGPEARDRALVRVIGAHVSVPCETGNPLDAMTEKPGRYEPEPELAAAAGLSLFKAY